MVFVGCGFGVWFLLVAVVICSCLWLLSGGFDCVLCFELLQVVVCVFVCVFCLLGLVLECFALLADLFDCCFRWFGWFGD